MLVLHALSSFLGIQGAEWVNKFAFGELILKDAKSWSEER